MELTNTEIKIVVKNMAREMVKRAAVKNAPYPVAIVHYIRDGKKWLKSFDTMEEAKRWAASQGMKRSNKPQNDGEYYITLRDRYNNELERY
jgi:hypothetical protein